MPKGGIFTDFLSKTDTSLDFFTILAAITVVFVNGFTDAPNAIFSVVSTGKLKLWQGALLGGIFNLLGVIVSSFVFKGVGSSILEIYEIGGKENKAACLACFLTVIIFGLIAWLFGMPSSESHALIFSLLGISFISGNGIIKSLKSLIFVLFGVAFSCFLSFFTTLLVKLILKRRNLPYKELLAFSCASLSFMHGAQDGQKFIALLLILTSTQKSDGFYFPAVLLVSCVMAFSTLLGGKRIILSMSKLSNETDFSSSFYSDVGAFLSLIACSLLGMPVSTGCIKSFSIIAPTNLSRENKKMISKILITSLITLPVSFVLGAVLYKIISLF